MMELTIYDEVKSIHALIQKIKSKLHKKSVKCQGGNVVVSGMFYSQGTTPPVRLSTRVSAAVYKHLLEEHVLPVLSNSGIVSPVFTQDYASCHKAKNVTNFLQEKKDEVLIWPAQSLHLAH